MLLIFGLYVAGFPGEHPEWSPWSQHLIDTGLLIFPENVNFGRRWTAVGWQACAAAIWLSPTLQGIFSNRLFMWLGQNSFAVYLTHGTLLRVVLARMIYGWTGEPFEVIENEQGDLIYRWLPRGSATVFTISIPIWFGMVYLVAYLWTKYVDSLCARITASMERYMFESEDEKSGMQAV